MIRVLVDLLLVVALVVVLCPAVNAGAKDKAIREGAEYILGKFGKEVAGETVATLSRRLQVLALRFGDDALEAARKVGPQAFHLVEAAGPQAPTVVKLLARHGDEAIWIVTRPRRTAIFIRHGDEAARALIRHRSVVEPLIEAHGQVAARALNGIGGQNARRLAMMETSGELRQIGRTPDVLSTIATYGDRAMEFIWKHKGTLAVTAVLAAFLADPEPYLDGTRQLTETAIDKVAQPLTEMPRAVAGEAARRVDWTLFGFVGLGFLVIWRLGRKFPRQCQQCECRPLHD